MMLSKYGTIWFLRSNLTTEGIMQLNKAQFFELEERRMYLKWITHAVLAVCIKSKSLDCPNPSDPYICVDIHHTVLSSSSIQTIKCGDPQVGMLLFFVYVNDLPNASELTLYTLTSVCTFSILFFVQFQRCWQGEFV